ncbi:AMP-binding protein [Paraburkholderia phosphatilytica]|uniref:AMP-binding protein n=1 Tax=Paraburkholderia phosphatilytica TaxID=2282883 RepID=UPI000E4A55EC|nr:AMP-binding protein [Paraburkholderia phosphatilytica]
MLSLPLVSHPSLDQTIAWRDGSPVPVRTFLADVARLAAALPDGGHVFNQCVDRYRFAVGLCATLVAGKISLLPPSHTPQMIQQLAAFAPDVFCLHDRDDCTVDLPRFRYVEAPANAEAEADAQEDIAVPRIDASRVMAYLFTSGSTGVPVPHRKTWGFLVRCLSFSAVNLGLADSGATLVGTVPPQHMYGFENTVLLALVGGLAFSNGQPFYPVDVARELAAVPAPRVLVTSPVHLRALMLSEQPLPPVALTLSATAPLAPQLAVQSEATLGAPLMEIYGSTETGQIATRRTAHGAQWQLYPGIRMDARNHAADSEEHAPSVWVSGGHVEAPVAMGDAIELVDDTHFLLHGRKADLINIAGKRTSLGYLNHQLNEIAGVVDGVFFMPDDEPAGAHALPGEHTRRLLAFVVAPGLDMASLQRALRQRIDAAFMPRPLVFVDALPRNATGKLPRDELLELVATHTHRGPQTAKPPAAQTDSDNPLRFTIPHDHPALPGHFPGQPIVPGVVLLDCAIDAIGKALDRPFGAVRLNSAKFLSPAAPGTPLDVSFEVAPSGAIRFSVQAGSRAVASGVIAATATRVAHATQQADATAEEVRS